MENDNKKTRQYGIPLKKAPRKSKATRRISGPVSPIRPASEKKPPENEQKEKNKEEK
ncbi:MAG TPA: hypothetical protein P5230_02135 [Candidatus Magasanikbacteria bacterium]|nr:hypothetical protein [Candidatus Magasanikbacteria bacterium]